MAKKKNANEVLLDNVVIETQSEIAPVEEEKTTPPTCIDPEWTKYVLSLMTDDELEQGMPKVDGLRRVATFLFGPFSTNTEVVQTPNVDNGYRATVVVKLDFNKPIFSCSGSADVFSGNTNKMFAIHPVATAETRAEGRALRRALRLTKVISAEELDGADKDEPNGTDNRIQSGVLNGLKIMASKVGVNLDKLSLYMGYQTNSLEDLSNADGIKISEKIGKFQRKEEAIPDEIK